MAINKLLGNSAVPQYVKVMSAGMLCLTYIGALAVEGYDLIADRQVPAIVTFVLATGVSLALTVLGIHQGAQLGEAIPQQIQIGGSDNASPPAA